MSIFIKINFERTFFSIPPHENRKGIRNGSLMTIPHNIFYLIANHMFIFFNYNLTRTSTWDLKFLTIICKRHFNSGFINYFAGFWYVLTVRFITNQSILEINLILCIDSIFTIYNLTESLFVYNLMMFRCVHKSKYACKFKVGSHVQP